MIKNKILSKAFYLLLVVQMSCTGNSKDKDIKSLIATTAKKEVAFTGVNYTVDEGVVTLGGICATEKMKAEVEGTVKGMAGVKKVVNQIKLAPVVITADQPLKRSVDSVLMQYAQVKTEVADSIIILKGKIKEKELERLLGALHKISPKPIVNQLEIKK